MKLNTVILDPSGNITLLVTSPVPRAEQSAVAARLLADGGSGVEQVGFVEPARLPGARARLQMMGGEFCGNASISLAALLALEGGLAVGSTSEVTLEVSGADGPVRCEVERTSEAEFLGTVGMPLPEGFGELALPDGTRAPLVRFPGIAHLIVPEGALSPAQAEEILPRLCAQIGADAMGLLLTAPDGASMRPLVHVRATASSVWEHGCASGTAAQGACAAMRLGRDVAFPVAQPGGSIAVRAGFEDGRVRSLEIRGPVRLIAREEREI